MLTPSLTKPKVPLPSTHPTEYTLSTETLRTFVVALRSSLYSWYLRLCPEDAGIGGARIRRKGKGNMSPSDPLGRGVNRQG